MLEETKAWNAGKNRKFNLQKDDLVNLPGHMDQIQVGLGWDTRCDIDASVIMMQGHTIIDTIYYG